MHSQHPRKAVLSIAVLSILVTLCVAAVIAAAPAGASQVAGQQQNLTLGPYILLGWNDLGMHCANKNFADLCVLPPFNNVWGTLIQRGDPSHLPQIVGSTGYRVSYAIEGNTYSVGKTDFWTYAYQLFGVHLPDNIGLTGNGLSGNMAWSTDHFVATGLPVTPYTDSNLVSEEPYQLGLLTAFDSNQNPLVSTEVVVPISNEMTCSACHFPNAGETVEHAILRLHDTEELTHLQTSRPVLCANCHGSNALGMPGQPGLPSLSQAMHQRHAEYTDDCYKCHPGPVTRCLRDIMSQHYGLTCQTCHGHMIDVATSIEYGRQPWLQEPRCGNCHGTRFSEAPNTLYRNSKNGHGGLYCEACHSSPHAILPSREERDNRQNTVLQGYAGTLERCDVCHGYYPSQPGPHGILAPAAVEGGPSAMAPMVRAAPNPLSVSTEVSYRVLDRAPISLAIYDAAGRVVKVLTENPQTPGEHTLVWDGNDTSGKSAPTGVYFARLKTAGKTATARMVKLER